MGHGEAVALLLFIAAGCLLSAAQECEHHENILAPGRWYQYDYEITAEASSVGSTDDVGDMSMLCRVKVSHVGSCKYMFEVQQCSFSSGGGPPNDKEPWIQNDSLLELTREPVVVTLSGGSVTQIDVSPSEPEHVLNIKRALISAFVLKKSHLSQGADTQHTDVHGSCPWKMVPGEKVGMAHSSKDMLYCTYPERADWNLSPWAIMWNLHFIQYLINSTVDCSYVATEDLTLLESLRCHERHAIKLESTHDTTTAVQTNIFYMVTLESHGPIETPLDDFGNLLHLIPAGIQFKHTASHDPTLSSPDAVDKERLDDLTSSKLSEIVQTAETKVGLYTIPLFHEFIELLRLSPDPVPFVESVASCNRRSTDDTGETCTDEWKSLAMSFLQDALIQSNTLPTLRAFRHLVTHGHVNDAYLPLAFHSWSFLRTNDSRYLGEVFEICKSTEHKMCWLLLGRILKKQSEGYVGKMLPPVYGEVVQHVATYIGQRCDLAKVVYPPLFTMAQKIDHLVMMLKTIKNAGPAAQASDINISEQLLSCAQNVDLPVPVAVFAIEALHDFHLTYDILSVLKTVLGNKAQPLEVRIAVYQLLTKEPQRRKFGKAFHAALLGEEHSSGLSDYVVSDFLDWLPTEAKMALSKVANGTSDAQLPDEIVGENLYKEWKKSHGHHKRGRSSNRRTFERRVELPFLPPELRQFAVKSVTDQIFGGWKNLISDISANITLQLFGNEFQFADIAVFFKEIDEVIMTVGKLHGDEWMLDWDALWNLLRRHQGAPTMPHGPLSRFPKLRSGLEKILQTLPPLGRQSLTPVVNLGMFGTDLLFTSYGEILAGLVGLLPSTQVPAMLKRGIGFDVTRTIRVIEGYHQVPTLMGLPLNWTTSATLVASLRSGAKQANQGTYEAHIHPSAALTFLNRMVLDFPTKTRIGIQANSSACTATHLNGALESRGGGVRLEFGIPPEGLNLLQLVRTNQMIKHNWFQQMGDWKVHRVDVAWCTGEELGTMTGLQLCHDRSYANVTHLMRPWFLMAAPASWQLQLKPFNRDVTGYVFDILLPMQQNQLKVEFQTKEGAALDSKMVFRSLGREAFELSIPGMPFFRFTLKTQKVMGEGKGNTVVTEAVVSYAPEKQLQLTYEDEWKQEKRQKPAKESNEYSKGVIVGVRERSLSLRGPENGYSASWTVSTQSTGIKSDFRVSFQRGPGTSTEWLQGIVADEFFGAGGSAWVQVQVYQKNPVPMGKQKMARNFLAHLSTPKTVVDLAVHSIDSKTRQLLRVNITKVEKATKRLLAFANFTGEHWSQAKGDITKRNALYNLTVSHHSWALHFVEESHRDRGESEGHLSFLAEKMVKKSSDWGFFSTWWHPSTSHLFQRMLTKTELTWMSQVINVGVSKKTPPVMRITATLSRDTPNEEHGELRLYGNLTMPTDGFEIEAFLENPKSRIKWNSYTSLVGVGRDQSRPSNAIHGSQLAHTSVLSRHDTFDATYRMQYRLSNEPCSSWELRHSVISRPWQFSSNLSSACDPSGYASGDSTKSKMLITIASASDVWDTLNLNLNQVFEFGSSGWESMQCNYTLGKIGVQGRWDPESFFKEANFWSKDPQLPPSEIVYNAEKKNWILDARWSPDQSLTHSNQFSLSKTVLRSGAAFAYDAKSFRRLQESDPERKESRLFKMVVIPRNFGNVVVGIANKTLFQELLGTSEFAIRDLLQMATLALNDASHPLNQILHPLIEMPVGQLMELQKMEVLRVLHDTWATTADVFETFHSLYDPVIFTASGLAKTALSVVGPAQSSFQNSIPGWAYYYFGLDSALHHAVTHMPELSLKLAETYFTRPVGLPGMREFSFEVPHLPSGRDIAKLLGHLTTRHFARSWSLPRLTPGQKVAAIFGRGHILTFDGAFAEFPSYPASYCNYLLAYDVGGHRFAVTTTSEDLLIDFPEISLTISGIGGKVFVNGSDTPVHLPLVIPSGIDVYREGHLTRVRGHGLTVYCDSTKFFSTIVLDPVHRGNLIGILGDANEDARNDFELPSGRVATDVAELASSFEVSGYAECKALVEPVSRPQEDPEQCRQQIPQSLKGCLVELKMEKVFMAACNWDVTTGEDVCSSINAVAAICSHHGHRIENHHCDPCHKHPDALGKKTFRTKSAPLLEVVVLLADSSFDSNSASSILAGTKQLVDAVDSVFKKLSYDTKYAFILSGGRGGDHDGAAHFRVVSEDIFVTSIGAAGKLLKAVDLGGHRRAPDLSVVLDYVLDSTPFDPTAIRVILAISANDFNSSRPELDRLHEKMEASGVTLYAFSNYPSVDRGKRVFGVRADGLVFPPSKLGDDYLDYPSRAGLLAKLAAATRGSAFHVQFVRAGRPKEFFEVVAEEVAAKVGKEAGGCRECTCQLGRAWGSLARCRPVGC